MVEQTDAHDSATDDNDLGMIIDSDLQIQANRPERLGCKRNLTTHDHISLGDGPSRGNSHKIVIPRQATRRRSTQSADFPGKSFMEVFPLRHRCAHRRPGPIPGYDAGRFQFRKKLSLRPVPDH